MGIKAGDILMNIEKWNLLNAFTKNTKKKKEADIILFPKTEDVFAEEGLEMFFTPILTYNYLLNGKKYKIHVLTSAGLICENSYLNSEDRFFGFRYVDGKYKFIGNLNTFGNSQIKEVYHFLHEDFEKNKDYYLEQKVNITDYMKMIKPLVRRAGHFTEEQSICTYTENFYSYEMTKYHYEKIGKLKHLFEITEFVHGIDAPYFFDTAKTLELLKGFYEKLSDYSKMRYDFENAKPVCSVDTFKFTTFSSTAVTFLNPEKNLVYTFEYTAR